MARKRAEPRPTEVLFYCSHCRHPLDESWNDVEGLMKPDDAGDSENQDDPFTFCPGCGSKVWFPSKYRRN